MERSDAKGHGSSYRNHSVKKCKSKKSKKGKSSAKNIGGQPINKQLPRQLFYNADHEAVIHNVLFTTAKSAQWKVTYQRYKDGLDISNYAEKVLLA